MQIVSGQIDGRKTCGGESAFTLVEILVSLVILATVMSGLLYGYVATNRVAEWSAMSLAAESYAAQGVEQLRGAQWEPRGWPTNTGPGTYDEAPPPWSTTTVDIMDIPIKGSPAATNFDFWVTNFISVTKVSDNPPLRQIQSDCVWTFPLTGRIYTNTVITLRAPDQ